MSLATDLLGPGADVPSVRYAATAPALSEVYERDLDAGETVLVSVRLDGPPEREPQRVSRGRRQRTVRRLHVAVGPDRAQRPAGQARRVPARLPAGPATGADDARLRHRAAPRDPTPLGTTLRNAGWGPLAVRRATIAGRGRLPRGRGHVQRTDPVPGAGLHRHDIVHRRAERAAAGDARIPDSYTGSPREASLRGAGPKAVTQTFRPRITIDPAIGPPGTVVVVQGTGFPPSAEVRLAWSAGITPHLPRITATGSGGSRAQVLVFHNDRTGARNLVATTVGRSDVPAGFRADARHAAVRRAARRSRSSAASSIFPSCS